MNIHSLRRLARIAPIAALVLLTAVGCRTLPNVSGFADATTQLYWTVQSAGDGAVAEVAAVEQGMSGAAAAQGASLSNKVAQSWQPLIKATKAVVVYSESLRALVQSGQQGKEQAQQALAAVDSLVKTTAGAFPGGEAGSATAEGIFAGVTELWGALAREIAARSLAQAIEKTDPVIQKVAAGLSAGFSGMDQLLDASETALLDHLINKYDEQKTRLNTYEAIRRDLLAEAVSGNNGFTSDTNLLARWQWAEKIIESEQQQAWYKEYMAEKLSIQTRLSAEREIVRKAPSLITAWAASHKELAKAVREKGSPDFTVLLTLSRDLYDTYQQTKARVEAVKTEALKQQL